MRTNRERVRLDLVDFLLDFDDILDVVIDQRRNENVEVFDICVGQQRFEHIDDKFEIVRRVVKVVDGFLENRVQVFQALPCVV